ncbi:MAG: 30S ribosomal protein S6 [Chloroflexi bacterium]|nr:MAG: 30S ribosomal protein S6 [Chloroflexota bacterium]
MRSYELTFIIHPEVEEPDFSQLIEKVKGYITSNGGQVTNVDIWGRRKLAYPIRRVREGQYVYMEMEMDGQAIANLERSLRLTEPIMRHLIVRTDED